MPGNIRRGVAVSLVLSLCLMFLGCIPPYPPQSSGSGATSSSGASGTSKRGIKGGTKQGGGGEFDTTSNSGQPSPNGGESDTISHVKG